MLNHVALQGRLVKDPEIRYTANQKAVAEMRLAVERDFRNENGERPADFFTVVCFGGTAEHIERYFKKGDPILVAGRLQQEQWQDKDGNKRESIKVYAGNVWFTQAKKGEDEPKKPVFTVIDTDDGDLPF